jgi:acyl-CoA ligase (AMP-forming) (exosortase A-associated)
MSELLFELPLRTALSRPDAPALRFKTGAAQETVNYGTLAQQIDAVASGLIEQGLARFERVAVYLPKRIETVASFFGIVRAGGVFVPVNPLLKAPQVAHILADCNVRTLITSADRLAGLTEVLANCHDLRSIVLIDETATRPATLPAVGMHTWRQLVSASGRAFHRVVDMDMAAILYTSGSTGKPKGVVLSHRNMVTGAKSVSQYLQNTPEDRLLAVLPFSFDYGFSQLSTAFNVGASVTLMDYLFPRDILTMLAQDRITGLAGVPPLWVQLADLPWPETIPSHLRYITNSGGAMPGATLKKLRAVLPKTSPFLMYGLTEAFRSTYLDPSEAEKRPDSIGKAIPNAEILVVRPDGSACAPEEPGELVHRGSLVAMGYWNDPVKTAERFKPAPGQDKCLVLTEMAVWSGDTVRQDAEGFLYFVGRRDEMIKTSGYRVSPTEVEEVVFATGLVTDAAAVGVSHPTLGQAIVIVAAAGPGQEQNSDKLIAACRAELPAFMVPQRVEWRDTLPRNPNGKYDRPKLAAELKELFAGAAK